MSKKTNFELVGAVLDELFNVVVAQLHATDPKESIVAEMTAQSESYADLAVPDRKPIDYSSALARFAYVYTYVAAHASWVADLLVDTPVLSALLESEKQVRATCLGGGPGTELIGLLKACKALGRSSPLSCFLVDGEDGWAETWAEIDVHVGATKARSSHSDLANPHA